ncbi:expressed unknown protein [Seminavis robusta]|uniref:Uncharacterized protein n=1 Tax=Seminavis robusta TaxID=568900 RepID=A0A9N8ERL8_9STRA|nr:expressed unknown protein [Seminavis robusta]|eukprot:Sro1895_g304010.1 n/a (106) ;mRNA; f:18021-18338
MTTHPSRVPLRRQSVGSRRQRRLLLSVRLLIRALQSTGNLEDVLLAKMIKNTVKECVRQNRAGEKNAVPLQQNLELRLQALVGPQMFMEAMVMVDFYQTKRQLRR